MIYAFCASLRLGHFRPYPIKRVFDLCVHSKLARRCTPVTPASGTVEVKPSPWFTHHWPFWVSLARIDTTSIQSSTDHGVMDFARVGSVTSCPAGNWHRGLHQGLRQGTARWQCSPTSDPTSLVIGRLAHRIRKAGSVHVSGKKSVISKGVKIFVLLKVLDFWGVGWGSTNLLSLDYIFIYFANKYNKNVYVIT